MKHGSLFSGIGGFDLAAQWMGWENVFHCEWNEFGQKALKYYWPNAITYGDITKTDFTIHRGGIDILTGGFPCQPYSSSGKRKGTEDDRHLWPEMLRAIREIQPRYVVGENVRGLTNWNGGLVFDQVQADLEAEGYEVLPFLLPACAVNAPHRRDRIWFVAYSESANAERRGKPYDSERAGNSEIGSGLRDEFGSNGTDGAIANSGSERLQKRVSSGIRIIHSEAGAQPRGQFTRTHSKGDWEQFPTESPIHNGNDGLSARLDSITFPKWREESIKAGGNAIVPAVVFQIFKAIQQMESA